MVTAALPLVELPVNVANALDKPCERLEGRALVNLVDLFPNPAWPFRTCVLLTEGDPADKEGGRTLARIPRDANGENVRGGCEGSIFAGRGLQNVQ